ncbi:MAG: cytochrome b/b6 domain-containing protein [Gammaproteobacteria bacterium]|nr:cytochrome b/b6 domain-containing protein [Gammaproteobacteria bacterium]
MSNEMNKVKVWDVFVRLFHWSLVACFFVAYITEEDFLFIHTYAGYGVLALILLRFVWGFIGTKYARFSDFIYSPAQIKQFLKDTLLLRAKHYLGHNPAAGAMILLMMASLLITALSGVALYGAEEQAGPLASWFTQSNEFWKDVLEEIHELFADFTVVLVIIHVAGVIVESLINKENLIKAMIDGKKVSAADKE